LHIKNVVIPPDYQFTLQGEQFLLHQQTTEVDGSVLSFLVFGTIAFFKLLCQALHVYMDGSFKASAKPFAQWFALSCFFPEFICGSPEDKKKQQLLPCLYLLLSHKSTSMYRLIFTWIKNFALFLTIDIKWQTSMQDFESGLLPALYIEFPNLYLDGCLFHFCQSQYKNISQLGLTALYKSSIEFKKWVRLFWALAFLPPQKVQEWFNTLVQMNPFPANLAVGNYIQYFKYWIERIDIWNVSGITNSHETNNDIEGWHFRVNSLTGNSPHLWKWIDCMREEQLSKESDYRRIIDCTFKRKLRRADIERANKRLDAKRLYASDQISTIQFLRVMSELMLEL